MSRVRRFVGVTSAVVLAIASGACTNEKGQDRTEPPTSVPTPNRSKVPLPPPVHVRATPQGVTLADPAFTALPTARAVYGRLGGSVYEIEMPRHWNGRLFLYMHGFEELGPTAHVTAPDFRTYLIDHGIAWAASSFSSTGLVPGRSADETAALWDFFARKYGRPSFTYVSGLSMGGLATHIAAERYANRFDGALAMCGSAGATDGLLGETDFFVAGAYAAGVTQAEFDASNDIDALIHDRILVALRDPEVQKRFEDIMIDLTGGPRAFDRQGFAIEEATNWRRSELLVAAHIAPNRDTKYRLAPLGTVTSDEFNRAVIRLTVEPDALHNFVAGNDITGRLRMPMLSLHTTGDGQVPIEQARILQQRVDAAHESGRLVQRVMRDAGHCGFTTQEQVAGVEAIMRWVEHGVKPRGTNVLIDDLRKLDPTFELSPRAGTLAADAVPGAGDRVVVNGRATLDGVPFDSTYLGAVVLRDRFVTACQYTLPPVSRGSYQITVLADAESSGCGVPGARVVLWTFAHDKIVYSTNTFVWPSEGHTATFAATFSGAHPAGAAPSVSQFNGEAYVPDGSRLPAGTKVEAYIGATRCGLASTRRTGSFTGYILSVVWSDSIPGCTRGAAITFRINGRPSVTTVANVPGHRDQLDVMMR